MNMLPVVHRYSQTSKMPSKSYSIPAESCITGSKLRSVPGSVCEGCYARTGRYLMPNVREPRDWNLAVWRQARQTPEGIASWTDEHVRQIGSAPLFRWFDSGDIQGVDMLRAIVEIANRCPETMFWLPTHEWSIVASFRRAGGTIPGNLVVRLSAEMHGRRELVPGMLSSSVDSGYGQACSAVDGQCGPCRDCWDPSIENIDYHSISKLRRLHNS